MIKKTLTSFFLIKDVRFYSIVCTDCTGKRQNLKEIVRNMNEFPANYDPRELDKLLEKDNMGCAYINLNICVIRKILMHNSEPCINESKLMAR